MKNDWAFRYNGKLRYHIYHKFEDGGFIEIYIDNDAKTIYRDYLLRVREWRSDGSLVEYPVYDGHKHFTVSDIYYDHLSDIERDFDIFISECDGLAMA